MNSRQDHILRVLSSIAVGTLAFCLVVLAAMLLGIILFAPWLRGDDRFPPKFVILTFISILAGWTVGVASGRKYYRHLEK